MGGLRMIAAASACLGIIPGVSCTSSRVQVYATVDRAWLALFASIQGVTARLFHVLGTLRRGPRPVQGSMTSKILISILPKAFQKCPQQLWTGAGNPVVADSRFVGGQNE